MTACREVLAMVHHQVLEAARKIGVGEGVRGTVGELRQVLDRSQVTFVGAR